MNIQIVVTKYLQEYFSEEFSMFALQFGEFPMWVFGMWANFLKDEFTLYRI